MAAITEVQYLDVNTYTHGTDSYPGIENIQVSKTRAKLIGIRPEGSLVSTGIEVVGTDEIPVTFQISSRSSSALTTLLTAAAATVTFIARNAGQGATRTVTMTGAVYDKSSMSLKRDDKGMFTISGAALTCTEAATS